MTTLGFSTFVRNEINSLPGLLDSIKGKFDDVVVIDTGSEDGTWKMLRQREGAGELRSYRLGIPFDAQHFHFGYVRSAAAHLCKTDWVMMLDADERMHDQDLAAIRTYVELAKTQGAVCIDFPRNNWMDAPSECKTKFHVYPDLQGRCVLNNGTVWWRLPVHESVMMGRVKGAPPRRITAHMHIQHFHFHFRKLRNDDGAFNHIYVEISKSDPEWPV